MRLNLTVVEPQHPTTPGSCSLSLCIDLPTCIVVVNTFSVVSIDVFRKDGSVQHTVS